MMNRFKHILILGMLLLAFQFSFGQDRFKVLEQKFNEVVAQQPGLDATFELSVSGISIQEFVRAVALEHNLNVSVSPALQQKVVNNFSNAKVKDVFLFLCIEHDLHVDFIGTIMAFKQYVAPLQVAVEKIPAVEFNKQTGFISLDLKRDSLVKVVQEITKKSSRNVIIDDAVNKNKQVSVFIQNRPFESALEKMAIANGLKVNTTDDNFFVLEKDEKPVTNNMRRGNNRNNTNQKKNNDRLVVKVENDAIVSINASDIPIKAIIEEVSQKLTKNYFLFSVPEEKTSLYIENVSYEQFLDYLLNGTKFTFKEEKGVYLVGERSLEGLRKTELVQMENRTIETVIDHIPGELKKDVEIKEFLELNGLILSGSYRKIEEIKEFLKQVDRVVPVIMVDLMIVEVSKTKTMTTGISLGLNGENAPTNTTGGYLQGGDNGGLNMTLNSQSINSLINSFNGYGLVNLGRVTPEFYASIDALETDGTLKRRSTPKLAALNGHESNLNIGSTEYYLVVSNNIINNAVNNTVAQTQNWESVQASLNIIIKPFVSADGQITLDLSFEQSNFTARSAPNAPPGTESRTFKSVVRMQDGEMILIGGLEEKSVDNNGRGLPFISRIPIIKWFFGQRTKSNSKAKLNIFIKPTVIY